MRYLLFIKDGDDKGQGGGAKDIVARSNGIKSLLSKVTAVVDCDVEPSYLSFKSTRNVKQEMFFEGSNAHIYDTKTGKIVAGVSLEANDRGAGYKFIRKGQYNFPTTVEK